MKSAWFQQDRAGPRASNAVRRFLRDFFEGRVLSNRYLALFEEGISWPRTSPHLNPFFCGVGVLEG
jgi:hypothetical protein